MRMSKAKNNKAQAAFQKAQAAVNKARAARTAAQRAVAAAVAVPDPSAGDHNKMKDHLQASAKAMAKASAKLNKAFRVEKSAVGRVQKAQSKAAQAKTAPGQGAGR